MIAASIVIAALNNIFPLVQKRIWALAFAFGLVHGLGFANVLADLGLPREALIVSLVGFNLGKPKSASIPRRIQLFTLPSGASSRVESSACV